MIFNREAGVPNYSGCPKTPLPLSLSLSLIPFTSLLDIRFVLQRSLAPNILLNTFLLGNQYSWIRLVLSSEAGVVVASELPAAILSPTLDTPLGIVPAAEHSPQAF